MLNNPDAKISSPMNRWIQEILEHSSSWCTYLGRDTWLQMHYLAEDTQKLMALQNLTQEIPQMMNLLNPQHLYEKQMKKPLHLKMNFPHNEDERQSWSMQP